MKETFAVDYQGVRFFVANDTESALEILATAGRPLPPSPKGVNTYLEIFTTAEGKAAAIFQQTGFDERETDMGSEVNGPMIVVGLDGQNAADIESSIETKLHQLHCAPLTDTP